MTHRQTLPNRRRCETLDFEHSGHRFSLTFSRYNDGRPAEIFLSSRHVGSPLEAIARDAAVRRINSAWPEPEKAVTRQNWNVSPSLALIVATT